MTADPPGGGIVVRDTGVALRPDHSRVVARFFVPGREDVGPGGSRAAPVIERLLGLSEHEVEMSMRDIDTRFADRHEHLHRTFEEHAALVTARLDPEAHLSTQRRRLLGASFTHEYSIEGAALCNPSAVLHPVQPSDGGVSFVLSVRGIGEGHRSSIGFRSGTIDEVGAVSVDAPGPHPRISAASAGVHHRSVAHARLAELGTDPENASYVLDTLPEQFDDAQLDARISALTADAATRRHPADTVDRLRDVAQSAYRVTFTASTELSERVLWPTSPAERHGMEDARFVRFVDDWGDATYYATYTAFDGMNIAQHLLQTDDFASFDVSPMAGPAAVGKGLALFPRKVSGRYVALSRSDRETNAIAFSDDLRCWGEAEVVQAPERPWEILQLGNCGSPIETAAGWLVVTHGVGPMRTYSLGVMLLDLDDPRKVLARTEQPILTPSDPNRNGYVPNVVYSCGGFAHGDLLVLPYGVGDQTISIATISIESLLESLHSSR